VRDNGNQKVVKMFEKILTDLVKLTKDEKAS
jgi:hypothetical protein